MEADNKRREQEALGYFKEERNAIDYNDDSDSSDDDMYEYSKSSASCYLSQINNIIFGPMSSRFWMLRKHINSTPIMK